MEIDQIKCTGKLRLKNRVIKSMVSISYLLSITASSGDPEVILAILNTAGRGHALLGTGNEFVSKSLWIIPKGRKTKEEVTTPHIWRKYAALPLQLSVLVPCYKIIS